MRCIPVFASIVALISCIETQPKCDAQDPAGRVALKHSDLSVYRADDGSRQPIKTADDWEKRRKQILEGAQEAMGPLPSRDNLPAFDIRITEDIRKLNTRRITMTIVSEANDRLPLDLYLPPSMADSFDVNDLLHASSAKKVAGVIALHPTGAPGKRIVAGEGGKLGRQYGLEMAQRGYVVVAPDYPSFGEYDKYDFANDQYISGTMKGIFNHMRCVDLLAALPFVDADRIGVIGHSLGGHNSIFLGVFDPRVKVIVSCCGWCPFHDYYGGKIAGWTSDRYMPLLREKYELNPDKVPFDFYELIAALAPRTFVSVSPISDENFDINGVKKAIPVAGSIYSLLKAREELILLTPECEHDFPTDMRMQSYGVMDRVLKHTPEPFEPDYSEELPRIPPTEPAAALKTFQVIDGFEIQQTAAEPLVTDPVAMSFDADGRLFVAEMRDYSEQDKDALGVVRVLLDTNNDGTFDDSKIFAEGLSWPTAIICANDGVFVGAAPNVYFIKDNDGDLKADSQEIVFTGFGRSNVQGLINSFLWGPDNRIYGSASTIGGTITSPKHPDRPGIECRGRDFSFDPKTLEIRTETGGGQHGMSFDDWGHRFVSANSDHAQAIVYRDDYLSRGWLPSAAPARVSIAVDGGQAPVFRISPIEPWRIVRTRLRVSGLSKGIVEGGGRAAGYFTGATGITIYRGDAWPADAKGLAVIGDVGSNIVHRKRLTPNGVAWKAERIDPGKELVASTDNWFRPVQYANAPDGCLHILDMYRETIEHPQSLPPEIKRHLDLTSGRDRGRLYRVAPAGYKFRATPQLRKATIVELVALLEHSNAWHRETASRLIYERADESAIPLLKALLRESKSSHAHFHVIGCLQSLKSLTADDIALALDDPEPGVREFAILASEAFTKSESLLQKLASLTADADDRVRMQLAFSLGGFAQSDLRRQALMKLLIDGRNAQPAIRTAIYSSLEADALFVFEALPDTADLNQPNFAKLEDLWPDVGAIVARQLANDEQQQRFLNALHKKNDDPALQVQVLQSASRANRSLLDSPTVKSFASKLIDSARSLAAATPEVARVRGLQALVISTFAADGDLILNGLSVSSPAAVQAAALSTLAQFQDPAVGTALLERWSEMSPTTATQTRELLLSRPTWTAQLLAKIDDGTLPKNTLTQSELQRLTSSPDKSIQSKAAALLESMSGSSREDVIRSYQVALTMTGDRDRGAAVFRQQCSQCHRIGTVGHEVGPNLATMKNRGAEAILTNVLDPNREVNPSWRDYLAVTVDGATHNGVLVAESATFLTLRRSEAKETSLARADLEALRDTGRSLMPEGLEKNVDQQAMADLVTWLMTLE